MAEMGFQRVSKDCLPGALRIAHMRALSLMGGKDCCAKCSLGILAPVD